MKLIPYDQYGTRVLLVDSASQDSNQMIGRGLRPFLSIRSISLQEECIVLTSTLSPCGSMDPVFLWNSESGWPESFQLNPCPMRIRIFVCTPSVRPVWDKLRMALMTSLCGYLLPVRLGMVWKETFLEY